MTYNCDFYAKIIVKKCIDKNLPDEDNILKVESYLKNIIYKEVVNKISDMRRASCNEESRLLDILGKEYYGE